MHRWSTTATGRGQAAHDVLHILADTEADARSKAATAGYRIGSAHVNSSNEYSERFATVVLR